ncbi:ABC transporter substrate-binding protein [Bacillus sp. 1P06AnD]|uniref:ABC transporter substrate-binding protein n=1 Tax=Bacillus sp. 1P06AnD TaxID=3132208 RepID=UPI00399F60ED
MNKRMMKFISAATLLFLLVFGALAGCGTSDEGKKENNEKQSASSEQKAFPVTFKDDSGNEVTIKEKPTKIVSVLPSTTETLFALGLDKEIVGVSDFDNYPEKVSKRQKIGSQDINVESVLALAPDVAFISEYHARSHANVVKQLQDAGITTIVNNTSQSTFDDTYKAIEMIAKATGTEKKAEEIVKGMKEKAATIQQKAKEVKGKKKVWIETSAPPEMYSGGKGTFLDELLSIIGAENVAGRQEGWIKMNEEEVVKLNPDVIVTTYGYYDKNAVNQVIERKGWQEVNAVKQKQIFDVNSDLVSRPGPRLADGLEALAKAVYPDVYQ